MTPSDTSWGDETDEPTCHSSLVVYPSMASIISHSIFCIRDIMEPQNEKQFAKKTMLFANAWRFVITTHPHSWISRT